MRWQFVDYRLKKAAKPFVLRSMHCLAKTIPTHRLADFHRGIDAYVKQHKLTDCFASAHRGMDLSSIVRGKFSQHNTRLINQAAVELVATGYEEQSAIPSERYWVFRSLDESVGAVIRLSMTNVVTLEIAANERDALTTIHDEICRLSVEHSVYRNQFVSISVAAPMTDDYGYSTQVDGLDVTFLRPPKIKDTDIIFDPAIKKTLQRNVISFFENRNELLQLGVPLQRGVLLYGPPGTGKTYTCQYLFSKLKDVTMITVSGQGLGQVRSICSFARMMQPTILVLEDVDLIFASRDINLYSSSLGEMMDELDAFKSSDNVLFMLTTNAIERLEAAIKDRPGRVSQCVYMGLPGEELRVRYLTRYLQEHPHAELSVEHVAKRCEGASQAFLEELVYRAVQIAFEQEGESWSLADRHFDEAFEEMTMHKDQSAGGIVGFRFGE